MRLVAEITGVSYQLVRMWKTQQWWADLVAEIRASRDMQVDTKLSKLVDKSLELVGDRLENGEIVWNKKTEQYDRIPVALAAANKVANDLLNQQLNLSKKKVVEAVGDRSKLISDQVRNLAIEFAKFNTNRTVPVIARVIEDDNALHDERQAGLQEAVREVRWTPGSDSRTGSEEQGETADGGSGESPQGGWEGRGPHEADEQGWEDDPLESEGSEPDDQSFIL